VTWSGLEFTSSSVFWSISADGIAMAAWASSVIFVRALFESLMAMPSSSATAGAGTASNRGNAALYAHHHSLVRLTSSKLTHNVTYINMSINHPTIQPLIHRLIVVTSNNKMNEWIIVWLSTEKERPIK
jgi:hypothetical protein